MIAASRLLPQEAIHASGESFPSSKKPEKSADSRTTSFISGDTMINSNFESPTDIEVKTYRYDPGAPISPDMPDNWRLETYKPGYAESFEIPTLPTKLGNFLRLNQKNGSIIIDGMHGHELVRSYGVLTAKIRGLKGGMQNESKIFRFASLPYDVQKEIASYLNVGDLSSFSKGSKALREVACLDEEAWLRSMENSTTQEIAYNARSINHKTGSHVIRALLRYEKTAYSMDDTDRRSFFRGIILSGTLDQNQRTDIIDATVHFRNDNSKADHLIRLLPTSSQQDVGHTIGLAENISDTQGMRFHILDNIIKRPPQDLSKEHLDKIIKIAPQIKNYEHPGTADLVIRHNTSGPPPDYVRSSDPRDFDEWTTMRDTNKQEDAVSLLKSAYSIGRRSQETLRTIIREVRAMVDQNAESEVLLWCMKYGDKSTKKGAIRAIGRMGNNEIKSNALCQAVPLVVDSSENLHEVVRASRDIAGDDFRGNVLLSVINNGYRANLQVIRDNEIQNATDLRRNFTDLRWVDALTTAITNRENTLRHSYRGHRSYQEARGTSTQETTTGIQQEGVGGGVAASSYHAQLNTLYGGYEWGHVQGQETAPASDSHESSQQTYDNSQMYSMATAPTLHAGYEPSQTGGSNTSSGWGEVQYSSGNITYSRTPATYNTQNTQSNYGSQPAPPANEEEENIYDA
jgi:hypothetical protein